MSHGKKIGDLKIVLDKHPKAFRDAKTSVSVDLRFDISTGMFHSQHGGRWYSGTTRDSVRDQLKTVLDTQHDLEWHQYISLRYQASIGELDGHGASIWGIERDRHDTIPDDRYVVALELRWDLIEYSTPFPDPIDGHLKRMSRTPGSPNSAETHRTDELPRGVFLWSEERENVLREILAAFSGIDQRLVTLFAGDHAAIATRLDGFSATRLLGQGSLVDDPNTERG